MRLFLLLFFPGVASHATDCATQAQVEKPGAKGCAPVRQVVPVDDRNGGMYMRVHPQGDYVMLSNPNIMVDLKTRGPCGEISPRSIPIRVKAEAFPVEPKWELVTSPFDQGGMHYYRLKELLEMGPQAQPDFVDRNHDEYYQSAAEIEGAEPGNVKVRTALYSNRRVKDLEFKKDPSTGKFQIVNEGATGNLCTVFESDNGPTPDQIRRIEEINSRMAVLVTEYRQTTDRARQNAISDEYSRLDAEMSRLRPMNSNFSQPVLSKDGTEVAFVGGTGQTLKVAKITGPGRCQLVLDLGFMTNKVGFSYPEKGKKGKIAFTANNVRLNPGAADERVANGVFIYDRDTKMVTQISNEGEWGEYPGFTKDGRVIYKANDRRTGKYNLVIVDTNQILDQTGKTCSPAYKGPANSQGPGGRQ